MQYLYNISPIVTDCKSWDYILQTDYGVTLNKDDSIIIKQTTTIANNSPISNGQIDIITHRFHNICGQTVGTGSFICKVDGSDALPTIGKITYGPIPIYVALTQCPNIGTNLYGFIWDTPDCAKTGLTTYEYIYQGDIPMSPKTIDCYVAVYHNFNCPNTICNFWMS